MSTITVSRTSFPTLPAAGGTFANPQFVTLGASASMSYPASITIVVGSSPTILPSVVGTPDAASFVEVAGATNVLSDFNYQMNSTTGAWTAIDGSGATPLGDYQIKVKCQFSGVDSATSTVTVHVVLASGDEGGAIQRSAIQSSAIETSAIATSALG